MTAALLVLLAALQRPQGPTVGDTVWIARTIAVPQGAAVRPQPWNPTGDVEALGPARLLRRGDSAEIADPAVVWRPGVHEVTVPGPLLLLDGGGVDSAPAYRVSLQGASVLPAGVVDSAIPVQPAVTTVHRGDRSVRPLLLFLLGAAVVLAPLHWWWRRLAVAPQPAVPRPEAKAPVARWADAGEGRAALTVAAESLRSAIVRGAPEATPALETEECIAAVRRTRVDWPVDELAALLRRLDAARFRPGNASDVGALLADTARMTATLVDRRA